MANGGRKIMSIALGDIDLSENSRQTFSATKMSELMVSMKQSGLLQPIGVTPNDKPGRYRLVFGYRRFHAAEKLGWDKIDAIYIDTEDEIDELIKNSIENVQRDDVSFAEQGRIFDYLFDEGLAVGEIASRVGCAQSLVSATIHAYRQIPRSVQKRIVTGGKSWKKKKIPNAIAASTAFKVLSAIKRNRLGNKEAEKLYELASEQGPSAQKIDIVSALLGKEVPLKEAIATAKDARVVTVQFIVNRENSIALEKKMGLSIHEIAYSWLEQNKELQVFPLAKRHEDKLIELTHQTNPEYDVVIHPVRSRHSDGGGHHHYNLKRRGRGRPRRDMAKPLAAAGAPSEQ